MSKTHYYERATRMSIPGPHPSDTKDRTGVASWLRRTRRMTGGFYPDFQYGKVLIPGKAWRVNNWWELWRMTEEEYDALIR